MPNGCFGGHEDQFLPLRLSARSVIRKQTVAATRGNGRDAPRAGARPEAKRLLAAKAVSRYRLVEALLPRRSCRIIRVELAE
jgi:hypothetical protein